MTACESHQGLLMGLLDGELDPPAIVEGVVDGCRGVKVYEYAVRIA